eukprot:tig00020812_g14083.t1
MSVEGRDLIQQAERGSEVFRTSQGFEIIIPPGVSHQEAARICEARLLKMFSSQERFIGDRLPPEYQTYEQRKTHAMQEFLKQEQNHQHWEPVARTNPRGALGWFPGKNVIVCPQPDDPLAPLARPGIAGGGLGRSQAHNLPSPPHCCAPRFHSPLQVDLDAGGNAPRAIPPGAFNRPVPFAEGPPPAPYPQRFEGRGQGRNLPERGGPSGWGPVAGGAGEQELGRGAGGAWGDMPLPPSEFCYPLPEYMPF